MAATIYSVRIEIDSIDVIDDCDWLGDGELYFYGNVGGNATGRSRIFKAGSGSTLDLSSLKWAWEFRVDKVGSIPVSFRAWDEDLIWDDPLGSVDTSVGPPWDAKKYATKSSSGKFILNWDVANTVIVPNKAGVGLISRQYDGSTYKSTLAAPLVGIVEITDVKGLNKPGVDDRVAKPAGTTKNSSYVAGYISDDNLGRIFTNRIPDGTWTKDTQYIELTAEVFPTTVTLPAGTKIAWKWDDPDDPTNESPNVRKEVGMILDPNDYTGGVKVGTKDNDNDPSGKAQESPKWEELDPKYALSGGNKTLVDVATRISKVRFHVSDIAGDNFKITADLDPNPGITLSVPFSTGIMTVWHRIELEYVKMASAGELPVDEISKHYDIACVQVDVSEKREISGRLDQPQMGKNDRDAYAACVTFTSSAGQFSKEGAKGWFFIGSANSMLPKKKAKILFEDDAEAQVDRVRLPAGTKLASKPAIVRIFNKAAIVGLSKPKPNDHSLHIKFSVTARVGDDLMIIPHDFHMVDDPDTAFLDADLSHYGFAVGEKIPVQVMSEGDDALVTAGISPGGKEVGGKHYFGGKLIIFTQSMDSSQWIGTLCHELCHAFDNAHKCGNWDWVQQANLTGCCMNYWFQFILDDATPRKPMVWTQNRLKAELCGPHIRNMRDYHLENNPGLGWG